MQNIKTKLKQIGNNIGLFFKCAGALIAAICSTIVIWWAFMAIIIVLANIVMLFSTIGAITLLGLGFLFCILWMVANMKTKY